MRNLKKHSARCASSGVATPAGLQSAGSSQGELERGHFLPPVCLLFFFFKSLLLLQESQNVRLEGDLKDYLIQLSWQKHGLVKITSTLSGWILNEPNIGKSTTFQG